MSEWQDIAGRARVMHGDALAALRSLPDACLDSVVSDPPYAEVDRPYGRLTEAAWFDLMREVVRECRRVLKPRGSAVFVVQPNSERVGRLRPWVFDFQAWLCREWGIVQDAYWWNFTTMPSGGAPHCGLLRSSVKPCIWAGPPDCYRNQQAVLCGESERNAEKRAAGLNRRYRSGSGSGRRTNDHAIHGAAERRGGVTPYNLLPFQGADRWTSGGAVGHPASTPQDLCAWWVRYLTPPGGVTCDPFMGSGTVGIAALSEGWQFVGCEKEREYFDTAARRLWAAAQQPTFALEAAL